MTPGRVRLTQSGSGVHWGHSGVPRFSASPLSGVCRSRFGQDRNCAALLRVPED